MVCTSNFLPQIATPILLHCAGNYLLQLPQRVSNELSLRQHNPHLVDQSNQPCMHLLQLSLPALPFGWDCHTICNQHASTLVCRHIALLNCTLVHHVWQLMGAADQQPPVEACTPEHWLLNRSASTQACIG